MKSDDLLTMVKDITRVQMVGMESGADLERRRMLPYFDAIFVAYRRALGDPRTVIPSPLHCALANAQRFVGELREGQDEHKAVLGADAMVRETA